MANKRSSNQAIGAVLYLRAVTPYSSGLLIHIIPTLRRALRWGEAQTQDGAPARSGFDAWAVKFPFWEELVKSPKRYILAATY